MKIFFKSLPLFALIGALCALAIYGRGATAQTDLGTPSDVATTIPDMSATAQAFETVPPGAALTATPEATSSLPTQKPVLRGTLNGVALVGLDGSSCWPKPDSTPYCDFVDVQPSSTISVQATDSLTFTPDPAAPAPIMIQAKFLDNLNPAGDPVTVDLTATHGKLDLSQVKTGRLEVDAVYSDNTDAQPFVSTVYLLQIGSAATAESTTLPASPEAITQIPVTEAAIGETPTVSNTTVGSTAQPATPEVTAIVATATAPGATLVMPESTITAPVIATTPVSVTVTPPATTPTVNVTIVSTIVNPPTVIGLTVPAETIQPPTITVVATTPTVPTIAPTITVPAITATVQPVTIVPTVSTATPIKPAITATPLPTLPPSGVPPLLVIVNGHGYEAVAVSTCVAGTDGKSVCTRRPTNSPTDRLLAAVSTVVQINFAGPRPTAITARIFSADGLKLLDQQSISPDNLVLYTMPATAGTYVFTVEINSTAGDVIYYYRLTTN